MKNLKSPPKLKGLDFSTREIFEARNRDRLLMITIFVSSLCDLRCKYCYASSGKKLPNELTTEEYKSIIEQGKELGARTVWVPGAGEPLLQKDFLELVEYVYSLDMTLVMFTNSTHMTEEIARFLYDHDVSVITKLNSFRKKIQDELAGRIGAYERIQRGLNNLLKISFNEHEPTRLGIESVICKQNYEEIPEIFIWVRERNIYPYLELIIHSGRARENSNLDISTEQEKELFYELLRIDEERFGYTWTPVPPYVATECNKLFYNLVVDSQGNVQPCCAIPIKLGNIREKGLKEIFHGSEILFKTRNMDKFVGGNCRRCKLNNCYYGCRSEAYMSGDLFGSYQRCWHME